MLVKAGPLEKRKEFKNSFESAQSFSSFVFSCPVRCDACCRRSVGPGLTDNDYQRISRQSSYSDLVEKRDHPIFPYRLKTRDGACIFLNNDGQCSIYTIRPILCRLYPLQLHYQWDGKLLWCLEHCPGVDVGKGADVDREYLENHLREILEIESESFLETLRDYVLNTKKHFTLLFKTRSGGVHSDWITKNKMKGIIWQMFQAKALNTLTPRGRLECIKHELLPSFEEILKKKAVWLQDEKIFYVDEYILSDGLKQCKNYFNELAHESAEKELMHLRNLENNGFLAYGAEDGRIIRNSQQRSIIVRGFDGRKIKVNASKLMKMLTLTREATQVEERYLNELQRREGRFGIISTDLTINAEVHLMFMAADALELKANAFAIEKRKHAIEIEEIKEAVWIVERHLSGLLKMVQE